MLSELSERADDIAFVHWEDASFDVLLILSGCGTDCATRPPCSAPLVAAAGESVDHWPVMAAGLPDAIIAALRRCVGKS